MRNQSFGPLRAVHVALRQRIPTVPELYPWVCAAVTPLFAPSVPVPSSCGCRRSGRKAADLCLYEGNPLDQVETVLKPALVMRSGEVAAGTA